MFWVAPIVGGVLGGVIYRAVGGWSANDKPV